MFLFQTCLWIIGSLHWICFYLTKIMVTRMIRENVLVVIRLNKSILYTTNYLLEIKRNVLSKSNIKKCVCFLLSRANKSFKLVYLSVIRFMLNIFALALILERRNTTNMPFSSSKARLLLTLM